MFATVLAIEQVKS